jgi:hypothetical protein
MQGLLLGAKYSFCREPERRADARRGRRTQMGDMVDLVLVQANTLCKIDLDFVASR